LGVKWTAAIAVAAAALISWQGWQFVSYSRQLSANWFSTLGRLDSTRGELAELKSQDQYVVNQELKAQIEQTGKAFGGMGDLLELKSDYEQQKIELGALNDKFVEIFRKLSELKYDEAGSLAAEVKGEMEKKLAEAVAEVNISVAAPASNELPGGGYSRQVVTTDRGQFTVAMVVAEGAQVVVDTAADDNCANNCPTLPLGEFVARNGGFAGINGGYFCPADYAGCAGKVNSFDTMVMRTRDKKVFNRDNNVYSTVPLVAMNGASVNFYGRTLDWGVGSGTGAVANYPMLVSGGQDVVNEGALDAKAAARGPRGFIGNRGGKVIIGHVLSATIGEAAKTLATLGVETALNLDGGGSAALWSGGYKVGPGRSLPVAIVLK